MPDIINDRRSFHRQRVQGTGYRVQSTGYRKDLIAFFSSLRYQMRMLFPGIMEDSLIACSGLLARLVIGLSATIGSVASIAQDGNPVVPETNVAVYQRLATECLGPPTESLTSFSLQSDERLPFIVSPLFRIWTEEGKTIYQADSTSIGLPLLRYRITNAEVSYDRIDRVSLTRSVHLAMEVRATSPDGAILHDHFCERSHTDHLERRHLAKINNSSWSETQAPPPPGGFFRRYAEPVVLTAAIGAVVYLFFTVRSAAD